MITAVFTLFLRVSQAMTAIRTVEKSGKHLNLSRLCRTVLGIQNFVYRIPQFLRNDRLVAVFNHDPILFRIAYLFFTFHGFVSLLAVNKLA